MIADPLTRRGVVIGGLLGTATLSGCSFSGLTTRKIEDPEAADRARIAQARDLSAALRAEIDAAAVADQTGPTVFATFASLHAQQIAEFTRSAGPATPRSSPTTAAIVTPATLLDRERGLAQTFRGLALHAISGQVAALLASAAAGIDQALAR